MAKQILIIKQDETKEIFDASKLYNSLEHSGAGKGEIEEVIRHIEKELKDGMTTSEIYRHAFKILGQFEKPVAARYSMKSALLAFGPSGYPFEDFIAEIFRAKGYNVKIGEIIQGACVKHEVDIIAQKDGKKIGAEIKFHNELRNRSDIKVALYVHSRFEDIKKTKREDGGISIDEDWIITNTKFASDAIKYGNCIGMKVIATFIIGVIIGYVGTRLFIERPTAKTTENITAEKNKDKLSDTASGLGQNIILVHDQKAGINVEIESVNLKNTGWVVINESVNGVPGNILGAQLFDSGSNSGIVELLRGTEEGKIYYAIIRQDDGDRAFDLTKDILMTDTDGKFVSTEFKVTETVSEEE